MVCLKRFLITFLLFHILCLTQDPLVLLIKYWSWSHHLSSFLPSTSIVSYAFLKYACLIPRPSLELSTSYLISSSPSWGCTLWDWRTYVQSGANPLPSWAFLLFYSSFSYWAFLGHHVFFVLLGQASLPFRAQAFPSLSHGIGFLHVHRPGSLSHFGPQQSSLAMNTSFDSYLETSFQGESSHCRGC